MSTALSVERVGDKGQIVAEPGELLVAYLKNRSIVGLETVDCLPRCFTSVDQC